MSKQMLELADRIERQDLEFKSEGVFLSDAESDLIVSALRQCSAESVQPAVGYRALCKKTGGQMLMPSDLKDMLVEQAEALYGDHGYVLQPLYTHPTRNEPYKSIEIVTGAFYKTRGNLNNLPHIVGPLEHDPDDQDAPWKVRVYDQIWKWGYDGLTNADGSPHNRDLVERVYRPASMLTEPQAAQEIREQDVRRFIESAVLWIPCEGVKGQNGLDATETIDLVTKRLVTALRARCQAENVSVPKAALAWLFGEEPDADGKLFGECREAMKAMEAKYPRRYWWRSKFRSMIPALTRPEREATPSAPDASTPAQRPRE